MNTLAFFVNVLALLVAGWPGEIQGTPAIPFIAMPFVAVIAMAQQAPRNRECQHLPAATTMLLGTMMARYGAGLGVASPLLVFTMMAFWLVAACQNFNQRMQP